MAPFSVESASRPLLADDLKGSGREGLIFNLLIQQNMANAAVGSQLLAQGTFRPQSICFKIILSLSVQLP